MQFDGAESSEMSSSRKLPSAVTAAAGSGSHYSSLDEKIAKRRKMKQKPDDDNNVDIDDDEAMDVDEDASSSDERQLKQGTLILGLVTIKKFLIVNFWKIND